MCFSLLTLSLFVLCLLQLKGSDLELTIVKGSSAPRAPLNGPACTYVNLQVKVNNKEQGSTWGENLFFSSLSGVTGKL